jgi:DNA-binding MarR family transcriptional regulator
MSSKALSQRPTAPPETAKDAPTSFGLLALFRTFGGYGAELLLDLGLHPGQELVLMQLYDRDGQTQTELQHAVGADHSTISRTIKRMEDAGLIARTASTEDRRAKVVTLTSRGAALKCPLVELWAHMERLAVSTIPASKLTGFARIVRELELTYAAARHG